MALEYSFCHGGSIDGVSGPWLKLPILDDLLSYCWPTESRGFD